MQCVTLHGTTYLQRPHAQRTRTSENIRKRGARISVHISSPTTHRCHARAFGFICTHNTTAANPVGGVASPPEGARDERKRESTTRRMKKKARDAHVRLGHAARERRHEDLVLVLRRAKHDVPARGGGGRRATSSGGGVASWRVVVVVALRAERRAVGQRTPSGGRVASRRVAEVVWSVSLRAPLGQGGETQGGCRAAAAAHSTPAQRGAREGRRWNVGAFVRGGGGGRT